MSALIVTYHAIEDGPAPLCIPPETFRAHLDALEELGVTTLTVSRLAESLREQALPERAVAITFDDGFKSAGSSAAVMLAERDMTATFFCVAGHLGGWSDWPSQPPAVPRLELATAADLRGLAQGGFEIGSHGSEHAPLSNAPSDLARRELEDSKHVLEEAVGAPVRSFAYPYGLPPSAAAASLAAELYDAACGPGKGRVMVTSDVHALPRVDAHYLRRPGILRRVAGGDWDVYLRLRALGAYARGVFGSPFGPLDAAVR